MRVKTALPDGGSDDELADLSNKARELPCGLWTDSDPQAPWDFREARS